MKDDSSTCFRVLAIQVPSTVTKTGQYIERSQPLGHKALNWVCCSCSTAATTTVLNIYNSTKHMHCMCTLEQQIKRYYLISLQSSSVLIDGLLYTLLCSVRNCPSIVSRSLKTPFWDRLKHITGNVSKWNTNRECNMDKEGNEIHLIQSVTQQKQQ